MNGITITQNSREGKMLDNDNIDNGKALKSLLDTIIFDNARDTGEYYSLSVLELSHAEKKLLLSYLVTIGDFVDFTSDLMREREAFADYQDEMQFLLDERAEELYKTKPNRRDIYDY